MTRWEQADHGTVLIDGLYYLKTEYAYDGEGRLTSTVDPAGNTWTSTYDALGRLLSRAVTPPAGASAEVPAAGFEYLTFAYSAFTPDAAGCVAAVVRTDHDPAGAAVSTRYRYDARGNLRFVDEGYNSATGTCLRRTETTYLGNDLPSGEEVVAGGTSALARQYTYLCDRLATDSRGTLPDLACSYDGYGDLLRAYPADPALTGAAQYAAGSAYTRNANGESPGS